MTKKHSSLTWDTMKDLVYFQEVAAGAGLGGDQEGALVVIFFESMKHITFNVFACRLFVDSETPSE